MKKKILKPTSWIISILILVFIFYGLNHYEPLGVKIESWILLLTACVILFYTIETHRLRILSEKQLNNSIMPILVRNQTVLSSGQGHLIYLMNIGNGAAQNIHGYFKKDNIKYRLFERMPNGELFWSHSGLGKSGLSADEQIIIKFEWDPLYSEKEKTEKIEEYFYIEYEDIRNNKYFTKLYKGEYGHQKMSFREVR